MTRFRQPVLIYNPAAGKIRRNPDAILQRTKAALGRVGLTPVARPTTGPGQAGEMARAAIAEGADLILVLGGDGTVNEVVQGMVFSNVPLAVLPGGTANCLAMELGLGSRIGKAAARLSVSAPVRIAVGRVTSSGAGRYFLLMLGAGLDAAIVHEVRPGLKRAAGKLAYWVAGLAQFRRKVAGMRLRVASEEIDCGFALVSRIRNYGGDLEIASGASLRKPDFEVVTFRGSNPLRYACYMLGVGLRQVQRMRGVRTARASRVELLTSSHTQVDGEYFAREPLTIEAVPDALLLMVPPNYG